MLLARTKPVGPLNLGLFRRLADRVHGWRDGLLTSPRFRDWALGNPLTRRIARRNVSDLFDLCASFVYTQILFASVRLNLFEILRPGPLSLEDLSQRLDLPPEGTERLLLAAAALRLAEARGEGRFGLGPLGAALVNNPGVVAMIEHHRLLYADLADPVAMLRRRPTDSALSGYWAYATADRPDQVPSTAVSDYSALMAASQSFIADDVLGAYDFGRHKRLLDIGGGAGAFVLKALAINDNLSAVTFDLPPVAALAQSAFDQAGLSHRALAIGGNFLTDELPQGADVISLVRVAHDHDDDAVRHVLAAIRRALVPGGALILAEPLAGTPGGERIGDAYFGFYLLAMGSGRPRSFDQLQAMLSQAGFTDIRLLSTRTPLLVRVIEARG